MEEVRRAFTPTFPRSRSHSQSGHRSRGRQQELPSQKKRARTVTRDVTLLTKGMSTVPVKKDMLYHHHRVVNCIEISSAMSAESIEENMEDIFRDKLAHLPKPRFQFVKVNRGKVLVPHVAPGNKWDGQRVLGLIGGGQIYIMATGDLRDGFDASLYMDMDVESDEMSDDLPEILPPKQRAQKQDEVPVQTHEQSFIIDGIDNGFIVKEDEHDEVDDFVQPPVANAKPPSSEVGAPSDPAALISSHVQHGGIKEPKEIVVSRISPFRSFRRAFATLDMSSTGTPNIEVKFFDSLSTVDDGGPRRDFLRLLLKEVLAPSTGLFAENGDGGLTVTHNAEKLENRLYFWAGWALSLIVLSGGPSTTVFSPLVVRFIFRGYEECNPSLNDIPSAIVRDFIRQIQDAKTDNELKDCINKVNPVTMEDGTSILLTAGLSTLVTLTTVERTVRRLMKFYAIGHCRSELEDFVSGLEKYEFLSLLRKYPIAMEQVLMVAPKKKVTGRELVQMFKPVFSEGNHRTKENNVMELWVEFLEMVDEGKSKITPPQILLYASGLDEVPLIGWGEGKDPSLLFDAQPIGPLPTASTCGPSITIPLWNYAGVEDLMKWFETALVNSPFILGN